MEVHMSADRKLTSDEIRDADIENKFQVKITIEFGQSIVGEKEHVPKEELLKILQNEIAQHPGAKFISYLKELEKSLSAAAKENSEVPIKITEYYGPCGSCTSNFGGRGYVWISNINQGHCLGC